MALVFLLLIVIGTTRSASTHGEMALANVTRFANGDYFTLVGTDCGLTRCMEVSHGTALAAMGGSNGCMCQCRKDTPAFREDRRSCVNHIDECAMASFGRGSKKPQIPFVFLPLKGQIIYPSKEIVFTDVEDAACAVTSAQYLSSSGWVTLRDLVDNDVPFGLYRDEGSTYLQWKGSTSLHARLEGRLVAAHVLCSAPPPARLATSCAAFRVAGATHNALLDVRSIPFHAGETVTTESTTQSHGLSVLESLAIGVCVLMLVFIYAAGIIFYIHYKQKQKKKPNDPEMNLSNSSENESTLDSRINMDSMRLKTNPLMKLDNNMRNDFMNDAGLSDVSEQTEDTLESSPSQYNNERNSSIVSAVVHTKRKKPVRPVTRATSTPERLNERLQRRSASPEMEKAPHSDLSILHCSIDNNVVENIPNTPDQEPVVRRKLYFNPVFFETEHLKNPPPAAIDFLNKLREVMIIAKEKMTSKRFIPNLSDIPEEESYHTIDLGWDIPCARRGRRFSAISLKRENSRRAIHCGGCPGCDSSVQKSAGLNRSNSCKTCVSEDYKQKIVQKWLEDVPTPPVTGIRPAKIAKVSGTPRITEPKEKEEMRINPAEPLRDEDPETLIITESILKEILYDSVGNTVNNNESRQKLEREINNNCNVDHSEITNESIEKRISLNHATRRVRKKLPPPPPPPDTQVIDKHDEPEPVLPEVKKNMEAVIRELNKCQRPESENFNIIGTESSPKIVIPVVAADSEFYNVNTKFSKPHKKEFYLQRDIDIDYDSLERTVNKQRRLSLDFTSDFPDNEEIPYQQNLKTCRERLSRSWRDLKNAIDTNFSSLQHMSVESPEAKNSLYTKDIFVHSDDTIYSDRPGPLTIEVRGSPIEERKPEVEDFDPDTLDRKPKKSVETSESKKCVEKILLKSGGSFKNKVNVPEKPKEKTPPEAAFTRKIGSLRQIYEAKTRAQENKIGSFYERRGSVPYGTEELATYAKNIGQSQTKESNDPMSPRNSRLHSVENKTKTNSTRNSPQSDLQRSSEEKDRFSSQSKSENLNPRKSVRRSDRPRIRKDLKKMSKTEDSGYLSTDSNESKRRARYLLQIKPKLITSDVIAKPVPALSKGLQIESDTDELESLCDGRSESGGESVETDSVFFGNYNDSKRMYEELAMEDAKRDKLTRSQEQIDSGFVGETNLILSGDSDSEHKSVISIVTGRDGRASASSSVSKLEDTPYRKSVEC
ncbi:uncharacterized protein LOC119831686 [Zerene cesonia]|uniref:uncharacterized protein LOC119831686 n=1 Tax=Zerene cesonia TaxID=33412 RepID=UPI0018E57CAC|nr:uncharacterized protein LOC119831686 [Zerene cesonia]XP_038211070.1 uncharacterized protein LOC119831686 [Zerene cesonia]